LGGVERLLGLLTLYPFRCQLCAHRFLAFLWRYSSGPRREYERVPAQYKAILYPAGARTAEAGTEGTVLNLSISGCLVEAPTRLPQGATLHLTIYVSDLFPPVEVEGAVVKSVLDKRLGLEFPKRDAEEENRLRILMEAHLLTRPR